MNDLSTVVAGPTLTIFPPRRDARRTIVVLGAPRGGTSLIAGVLGRLGVFMGEDVDPLTGEDRSFLSHNGRAELFSAPEHAAARQSCLARAGELIRERSAAHELWGWKDPLIHCYLNEIIGQLRNPAFIFITRDPGAIAQRLRLDENAVARRAVLAELRTAAEVQARFAELISSRARPTLLVSYERALRAPGVVGHAVADFLGITPPKGFDGWLADFIVADRLTEGGETRASRCDFASTPAVRSFIAESLRPRAAGLTGSKLASDPALAANSLYEAAAHALNLGDTAGAEDRAFAILNLHAPECPGLCDGALGVLAECAFGGAPETVYPDIVCGAFHLLGLAHLLGTAGQRALIALSAAEALMRRRLELKLPGSILSAANYWNCVFHAGVAAKAMGRGDIVARMRGRIFAASARSPAPEIAVLGVAGLAEMRNRMAAEL